MEAPEPIRPPAVAGLFYPGEAGELEAAVEELLSGVRREAGEEAAAEAVIAPHAGYVYSGPVAASAFAELRRRRHEVSRVVLLGPAHRVPVRGLALPGAAVFETPLGGVAVDRELVERVEALPQVRVSPEAHAPEHSLEVELPFLQRVLGDFRILPLVVGDAGPEEVAEVLEALWDLSGVFTVISSDLSHYLPYDRARETDEATVARILRLEGPLEPPLACGATPINGLLLVARRRGLRAELLDLRSSGDTAGDRRQVVGYAAIAFRSPA